MKRIKFSAHLVPLILAGEKTSTWRLFDDKNLSVGDNLEFMDSDTGNVFGTAVILSIKEKNLGDIQDADFDGHEKFSNKEAMLEAYRGYYGSAVDENTTVKMISFDFSKA